ncbi:hypothetical protein V8B97DRAFT_238205 [Scleroderma yunnanense]
MILPMPLSGRRKGRFGRHASGQCICIRHPSSGEHSGMVEDHLPAEVVLSGLLYFHRISDNKVAGTPSRNLNVFKKLRGRDAFKNVILVTVMWGEGLEDIGLQRDKELQHDFWKVMTNLGSTTHRFHFTEGSAWEIINIVLVSLPSERRPLLIQQKIADEHKPPHVTSGEIRVLRFISYAFLGIKRLLKRSNSGPKGNKDGQNEAPSPLQCHNFLRSLPLFSISSSTSLGSPTLSTRTSITISSHDRTLSEHDYRLLLQALLPT